jgi:tetratricopeptide (TPR) repeat protein
MGDPDAAIKRMNVVLDESPDHPVAHELLGVAYMAAKKYPEAEKEFLLQQKVNSKSDVVYLQLAASRAKQRNPDGVESALLQGLGELPGDVKLTSALATFYLQQGNSDRAATVYEGALESSPNEQRFMLGLAGIRERQGRIEDAIELYEASLASSPDSILVINNLAALLADHRTDEASLNKARELADKLGSAKQPVLLDTRGWVYYRLGDYEKAAQILTTVVEAAPEEPIFRYHLGMTYYKQGDTRAAKELLSGAVAEGMMYEGVDEARQIYKELGR